MALDMHKTRQDEPCKQTLSTARMSLADRQLRLPTRAPAERGSIHLAPPLYWNAKAKTAAIWEVQILVMKNNSGSNWVVLKHKYDWTDEAHKIRLEFIFRDLDLSDLGLQLPLGERIAFFLFLVPGSIIGK